MKKDGSGWGDAPLQKAGSRAGAGRKYQMNVVGVKHLTEKDALFMDAKA